MVAVSPVAQVSTNEASVTIAEPLSLAIPDSGGGSVSASFEVTDDLQIENLQLTLDITHSWYGDVYITLTAPDGTVCILDDRTVDSSSTADFGLTWTFGVNALRGQSTLGTWTMTFSDTASSDVGTVTGFTASFYGTTASANDVYDFTDEFETLAVFDPSRRIVVDTDGGVDWLNFAAVSGDLNVNLAAGAFSTLDDNPFISIAIGSAAENASGGDGSDSLTGTALNNVLYGMRGDDTLYGLVGNDTLAGGQGADYLDGGGGFDTASYALAAQGVSVTLATPGVAQDTIGAGTDTLVAIERLIGSVFADTLTGNAQANIMTGRLGDDVYYLGTGDRIVELLGGGIDTVRSMQSLRLDSNVEDGVLEGSAAITTGNTIANVLTGNDAANVLSGGGGDDTLFGFDDADYLDGGGGTDRMEGGSGDDTYVVNASGDVVVEIAGVGGGTDVVRASVTYTLGSDVENLTLTGGARIGTGNGLGNRIQGSVGNDTLSGLAGVDNLIGEVGNDTLLGGTQNDSLTGGVGRDTMTGGTGADQFRFDDGDTGNTNAQADVIADFSRVEGDRINLSLDRRDPIDRRGQCVRVHRHRGVRQRRWAATLHDRGGRHLHPGRSGRQRRDRLHHPADRYPCARGDRFRAVAPRQAVTKLSSTRLRPAFSNSISSLLPSISAIAP